MNLFQKFVLHPLETKYVEIPLLYDTLPTKTDFETEASSQNPYAASRAKKWLKHLKKIM